MTKKDQVRSYYDQYSSQYDSFYGPIQYEKFQHVREYLTDTALIVDFGGGTGIVSEWLISPVINLDISFHMLHEGLQKRNFLGIAADLEKIPFRNKTITSGISLTAIQNVDNPKLAIKEISRSLTDTGSCIITILNKKLSRAEIEGSFEDLLLNFEIIPFQGEDYCYLVST